MRALGLLIVGVLLASGCELSPVDLSQARAGALDNICDCFDLDATDCDPSITSDLPDDLGCLNCVTDASCAEFVAGNQVCESECTDTGSGSSSGALSRAAVHVCDCRHIDEEDECRSFTSDMSSLSDACSDCLETAPCDKIRIGTACTNECQGLDSGQDPTDSSGR